MHQLMYILLNSYVLQKIAGSAFYDTYQIDAVGCSFLMRSGLITFTPTWSCVKYLNVRYNYPFTIIWTYCYSMNQDENKCLLRMKNRTHYLNK